jgi:hypothetical protein
MLCHSAQLFPCVPVAEACYMSPLSFAAVFAGTYLFLSYCVRSLRHRLLQEQTGVLDVPSLGVYRPADRKIRGTAVVCGGRQVWSSSHVTLC